MVNRIDLPLDLQIYGWSVKDILKVQDWLKCQNATLADLDNASINFNHWPRVRLHETLQTDFK